MQNGIWPVNQSITITHEHVDRTILICLILN